MSFFIEANDTISPGGRAALLARLLKQKIPVEPGFIVAAQAFDSFVEHNRIQEKLQELLSQADQTSMKDMQAVSRQVKKAFLQGEFPEDIARQILSMYLSLGQPRVMLSPSFFTNDDDNPLFREFESRFYGYQGDANLFEGVKEVWSHFFDSKPLFYRLKHGQNHFALPFSVCVQRQPIYKVTALMHTDDPTSKTKQTTIVKAVFGEGALVEDLMGADYYWMKRGTGEIYNTLYDAQGEKVVIDNGRERNVRLPSTLKDKRKLSSAQLESIAKLARDLQQHFFFPQECVIGIDGTSVRVIETKEFISKALHDTAPVPATPMVSTRHEPAAHTYKLGLFHPWSGEAHLPIATTIEGHLCIDPRPFTKLQETELSASKQKLFTHEVNHALEFITSHVHANQGLLYVFDSIFDSPDQALAQAQAISHLHTSHPALPIGLVSIPGTFEEYQRITTFFMTNGLPRSSKISHIVRLKTPASLYTIADFVRVGLDALMIDIDALSRAVHGDANGKSDESEALFDLLRKVVQTTSDLGLPLIVESTNVPSHAMLDIIQSAPAVEWLTNAKSYARLTTK